MDKLTKTYNIGDMPHRIMSAPLEMLIAWFSFVVTATAGIDDLTSVAIWDKSQLRLWCMLGSIGGAFLAVAVLPSHENTGNYTRRIAMKFASSGIAGLIFTPIVIRWRGWPVDSDVVLAVSATVALLAVGTISMLYPIWVKWILGKAAALSKEEQKENIEP